MWQADAKFGPYLKIKGKMTQVFFVGFIDDATRYIVHGEFTTASTKALSRIAYVRLFLRGVPQRLFFDNGKEFRTKQMERACAILGIKLIFTAPTAPNQRED